MTSIELRPAVEADMETILALHHRSEAFDGVPRELNMDDLRERLDGVEVLLDRDVRMAVLDGEVAGYAVVWYVPTSEVLERCFVFGLVDPPMRGRGVGRALLGWGMDAGRVRLEAITSGLPKYLRVEAYEFQAGPQRLFARMGFTPVRWFEELLRPLTDLPEVVGVPGVTIAPRDTARDEEIRLVKNEAFLDHWGSAPTGADHWDVMVHGPSARPELSCVAIDDASGGIVACCLIHRYEHDDAVTGRRDGSIDTVGTLAAWRGVGLASAMITRSLHEFAKAGLTHASIYVDGDNPTGAARLYRSLGFEPVYRAVTSQIRVE